MLKKPRTILTTDLECDDMNSLIHLCLYLNELELEGIVYTSSQFHFNGDGVHTLGEVTPHYCCQGMLAVEGHIGTRRPDPEAKDLMSYRPFEEGWIEDLFRNEYAAAYPYLSVNAAGFPTPEEMLSKVCYGNIAFEGDVRFETEGSKLIERCIMDEREDTLYLQSWGGVNTIVRALLSIYEKHHDTPEWEKILEKVVKKVAILGVFNGSGQDNSFLDCEIPDKFPGIVCLRPDFGYASFMTAKSCQEDTLSMMQGAWMYPRFKVGHGPLMNKYALYGDGTVFKGEVDKYQYGLLPVIDWGYDHMPILYFDQYDILGEGDSGTYIPLFTNFGLRGMEDRRYGTMLGVLTVAPNRPPEGDDDGFAAFLRGKPKSNPFLKAYHEDFAARAEWCVKPYEQCNHNPVVTVCSEDVQAAPGETIALSAEVKDVRPYSASWMLYQDGSSYAGDFDSLAVKEAKGLKISFTVPEDAKSGDFFNLILSAKNYDMNPMTGYGQVIVHVM